jgi:hypothetical protein
MSSTRYGQEAVRNPQLVHDLRRGRTVGNRILHRVMRYIKGSGQ